jgi:hypothetical protein
LYPVAQISMEVPKFLLVIASGGIYNNVPCTAIRFRLDQV